MMRKVEGNRPPPQQDDPKPDFQVEYKKIGYSRSSKINFG